MPTVSVITPTFNRCPFLRRALRSVEQQTFRDFELLVLDDGSTDGTVEFLDRYNPDFPFRWFKFDRKERSYLRNYAAQQATGRYLAFLDDDDEWLREKLERQVEFHSRNLEIEFSYTRTQVIDCDGLSDLKTTAIHEQLYDDQVKRGHRYSDLAYLTIIFTSTIMIRRSLFLNIGGYDERYTLKEDLDLYLRCALVSEMACVGEQPLVRYRVHDGDSSACLGNARIEVSHAHLRAIANDPARDPNGEARRAFLLSLAKYHYWADRYDKALEAVFTLARESCVFLVRQKHWWLVARIIGKWFLIKLRKAFQVELWRQPI